MRFSKATRYREEFGMALTVDMKFDLEGTAKLLEQSEAPVPSGTWKGRVWSCLKGSAKWAGRLASVASTVACVSIHTIFPGKVVKVLSAVGIGASAQSVVQTFLPKNALNRVNNLNKNNALKIWFTLTQLYFYFQGDTETQNRILTAFSSLIGVWGAVKVFDLLGKKLTDIPLEHPAAINAEIDQKSEAEQKKKCDFFLEPLDPRSYSLLQLLKIVPGIICVSYKINVIGVFLIGNGVGELLSVGVQQIKRKPIENQTCRKVAKVAAVTAFVIAEVSWPFILGAYPNSLVGIGLAGAAAGFPSYFYKRDFQLVPRKEMDKTLQKINGLFNMLFLGGVGLWVGYNYQMSSNWGDRAALITSAVVLPISMASKYLLINNFKWGASPPLYNSAIYYSEHTSYLAVVYALEEIEGKFGSKATAKNPLAAILAGWVPYMASMGLNSINMGSINYLGTEGYATALLGAELRGKI